MQHRKTLSGLLAAPLLAAVLAAPAMAGPADPPTASSHEQRTYKDVRGEASADTSRPAQTPHGLPTWPVNPKPLTPPASQPVATTGDGGDVDVDWPVAALAMAGTLLLGGGMGVAATRRRIGHTQAAG
jgi:hypothetical protein